MTALIVNVKEFLRDAVKHIIGENDQRVIKTSGGNRFAAQLQSKLVRLVDIEERDVQHTAFKEGLKVRMTAPVVQIALREVRQHVAERRERKFGRLAQPRE